MHSPVVTDSSLPPQFIRTFSKPVYGAKLSLKQASNYVSNGRISVNNVRTTKQSSQESQSSKAGSLEKHEHRFKFLMNNLNH